MTIDKKNVLLDTVTIPEDIVLENVESKVIVQDNINEENIIFNDLYINNITCEEDKKSFQEELQISEQSDINNQEQEIFEKKETVKTNCLALTVRKNYTISIFKNTVFTTFRITCKVTLCTFLLNFLSLFF